MTIALQQMSFSLYWVYSSRWVLFVSYSMILVSTVVLFLVSLSVEEFSSWMEEHNDFFSRFVSRSCGARMTKQEERPVRFRSRMYMHRTSMSLSLGGPRH